MTPETGRVALRIHADTLHSGIDVSAFFVKFSLLPPIGVRITSMALRTICQTMWLWTLFGRDFGPILTSG